MISNNSDHDDEDEIEVISTTRAKLRESTNELFVGNEFIEIGNEIISLANQADVIARDCREILIDNSDTIKNIVVGICNQILPKEENVNETVDVAMVITSNLLDLMILRDV